MHRIKQLDGVRALAVGLVLIDHAVPWFAGGGIGVCIFFVLSGYLITSLLLAERGKTGRIRLSMFYMRRALRLYPALLLMLVSTVALVHHNLRSAVIAATYTTDLFMAGAHDSVSMYSHTWSLALEEQFYLLWPLLLPAAVWLGRRISIGVLIVLSVASAVAAQIGVRHVLDVHGNVGVGVFNPLWQAHGLLIGCALAFAIRERTVALPRLLTSGGLVICFVVAVGASWTVHQHWAAGWNLLAELGSAALVAGLRDAALGIGRIFALPPAIWIGARSYAIYLWHLPLIVVIGAYLPGSKGAAIAVALSFGAAALSWRAVEVPFLRLKKRFEPATPDLRPASAAAPPPPMAMPAAIEGR